jgi:hypothetical protein|tara:strand:+ start:1542 stop:2069 length:528 start_codon:yes stop_codon:yes gene_type:complete
MGQLFKEIFTIDFKMNENATIYLIEDINDLRYVGSTGEKRFEDRLSTHRRDKKDGRHNCTSSKLNLYNCSITALKVVKNNKNERDKWESHYINNVYPECVNFYRFPKVQTEAVKARKRKEYYHNNRDKFTKYSREYRSNNREYINEKKRIWYQENKEKVLQRRKQLRHLKFLESL